MIRTMTMKKTVLRDSTQHHQQVVHHSTSVWTG